jgi:alpha-beta hydrolase superfamily lysophospholipase
MGDIQWKPDILGDGYAQTVLELGADPDGEGQVDAVLVRREPRDGEVAQGAVLYVHGFTDYFFQTALADFFAQRGLAFYALDLRKSGRARRPGHTAHYAADLAVYDAELERALAIVGDDHPGQPVIVVAHSTGGLIVPLWLDRRRAAGRVAPVAGLVLNSPWLDLQGKPVLRGPVTQALRALAKAQPMRTFKALPGVYGRTLHVSANGEWEYDLELKPLDGFPVTIGWLNAVRRGHARLHRGLDVGVPSLVLRSGKSDLSGVYSALSDSTDTVLDTEQIARWAGCLGGETTVTPIEGARHDVFLSQEEARQRAYTALDAWLSRYRASITDVLGAQAADAPASDAGVDAEVDA